MDVLLPLLIMLALYLVPELLKRRKNPKEYKYPDIPDKMPQPSVKPAQIIVESIHKPVSNYAAESPKTSLGAAPKPAVTMPAPVNVPYITDSISPWQGKLSPHIVQNGLIFAEILQPPRAYRPIWRRPQ